MVNGTSLHVGSPDVARRTVLIASAWPLSLVTGSITRPQNAPSVSSGSLRVLLLLLVTRFSMFDSSINRYLLLLG